MTTETNPNSTRRRVSATATALMFSLLVFSGCGSEASYDAATTAATVEQQPLATDVDWEHTISGRSNFRTQEANRETGRAVTERLEHIAAQLDRLIEIEEHQTKHLQRIACNTGHCGN